MKTIDRLAHIDRLSSLDAGFLALEGADTPMHMGSLSYLEPERLRDRHGRIRLGELRKLVARRLAPAPRFRERPTAGPLGLGRPVWLEDPDFDVANHVKEVALPPPGSEGQLLELTAQLMMARLERSRPLWELWVVDGSQDGSVVLLEKVHHVMMDGISGVDVVMLLTDPTPRVERSPAPPYRFSKPLRPVLAGAALADELALPLALAGLPLRAAGGVARLRHRASLGSLAKEVETIGEGSLSLVRSAAAARPTSLNAPVGGHRLYEHAEVPLAELQRIGHAFDCTLNDVVLTAVTGGLRRLLLERKVEPKSFQVAVPVSTRGAAEHLTFGNRVAVFLLPLPVDLSDEAAQLAAVRRLTRRRKEEGQAAAVASLVGAADSWPMPLVDLVARLVHRQPFANAVVTNVPGPPDERYMLGARIRRVAPIVPLARNLDLSVAALSYDGELSFGCLADAERCKDVAVLVAGLRASLEALGALAEQRQGERT